MSELALPWGSGYMTFDRDKLSTAYLVFLDSNVEDTMNQLMNDGWDMKDAVLYARAAEYCFEKRIEP